LLGLAIGLTAVSGFAVATRGAQSACVARPVADASSPKAPLDTCIPDGFSDVAIDYFDD